MGVFGLFGSKVVPDVNDSCDKCGKRGYLTVKVPGGGELLLCKHHADEITGQMRRQRQSAQREADMTRAAAKRAGKTRYTKRSAKQKAAAKPVGIFSKR